MNRSGQPHVVIAMSGGVDSSVAAALLVQQGYQVTGMMLRLWSEPGREAQNRCCTPDDMQIARRVAAMLDIPFYAIDARQIFYDTVVKPFMEDYAQGITPNPCLTCNRLIRWEFLFNRAGAVQADYLATGHYVRLQREPAGMIALMRAVDRSKDQSYVLHMLSQQKLQSALFPLGEMTKTQVRAKAHELKLPAAGRPESQDLCFLGSEDYRDFLARNLPEIHHPGTIVDTAGKVLGEHRGLAFYTIGQRKGLGIASLSPLYVIEKDIERNILIIGPQASLGKQGLVAERVNWISGHPPQTTQRLLVKIRYKAADSWAEVTPQSEQQAHVLFEKPMRDITPGQAVVFYDGETCLGGGTIVKAVEG